jgi:hypothetical protein
VLVTAIVLVSFFLYASSYYPLLNSDDGLNILMTYYYELPRDLYCWGQDRGGTLIPFISQIFHRALGLSPVDAVSASNYLILILGYLGFASLFKSPTIRILFAVLWFMPSWRFIDLLRFPIGVQYSLVGFSLLLIRSIDFKRKSKAINHLLLLAIVLTYTAAVWASDLAIVNIVIVLSLSAIWHFHENKSLRLPWPVIVYTGFGALACAIFILYAKSNATAVNKAYTLFNDWSSIMRAFDIVGSQLLSILNFTSKDPAFGVFSWSILVLLAFSLFAMLQKQVTFSTARRKWLFVFLLDFIAVLGVIFLAKWVLMNNMGRWYFVTSYISATMVVLLVIDNIQAPRYAIVSKALLGMVALIGAFSTIHFLLTVQPKHLKPAIEDAKAFTALGEIGIIADFWNAYLNAAADPATIKATPKEGDNVRNDWMVEDVFEQPRLFVIKDNWFDEFPDTLSQFGYLLAKTGDPMFIGNCHTSEYKRIKRHEMIDFMELNFANGVEISQTQVVIRSDSTSLVGTHAMWGPYISLAPGSYTLRYTIFEMGEVDVPLASFEVTALRGAALLTEKPYVGTGAEGSAAKRFDLDFTLDHRRSSIEFRIIPYGKADLIITEMFLIEH